MKNKKQKSKFSFFLFPDKINLLTYFLAIILYAALLGAILAIAFPKRSYRVILDYPYGEYNEDLNIALYVRTTPQKAGDEEEKIELSHRFYAYLSPISANKPKKVRFAFSGLDTQGRMQYFFETDRHGKEIATSVYSNYHHLKSNLKSEGFSKYFIKVVYDRVLEEDAAPKTLKISENVLTLGSKELKHENFDQAENDYLDVSFKISEASDKTKYTGSISLEPKIKEEGSHINVQSWLVTEGGKIYPFIGVYNYTSSEKFNPSHYPADIHKYLNVEYIYAKAEYRDLSGNTVTIYYKEKLTDLLG